MSTPGKPLSALDLCAAVAVVLIWGLNFIPMKIGLRELTPMQLVAGTSLTVRRRGLTGT